MVALFLTPEMAPFAVSLGLLLGLFALELAFLVLGGSLLTSDATDGDATLPDAPDVGLSGMDLPGLDLSDLPEVEAAVLNLTTVDLGDYDLSDVAPSQGGQAAAAAPVGLLAWLGIGQAPFIIWLATFLAAYGVFGTGAQLGALGLFEVMMPAWIAGLGATPLALAFAQRFAISFARLLPQSETSALSQRSLGRRRGVVAQGTARSGKPAQVRVLDGYGNFHYLRAEPLEQDAEIAQGTEVLVLRNLRDGGYRILPLS
ncbi:OB-fold-containig protein [Thalassobius sp. Cn5-15]|uniref:OB-fold-containig protein n=1 Tax=Thalassobius sp. Cn5-15 TaxID=2917763 RepID=UPI001EF23CA5|nr:YqiJ family protein [Thalassobius sp. Cn5-15]